MRLFAPLLIALLFVLPARATPPDIISLDDRVIGFSATQVFILRETDDNLGLYIYGLHDVFLVAKSIETGVDEEIWPVYRVHSAAESTPQTRSFPLVGAVNPFEILAARGAQYIGYGFLDLASGQAPAAGFDEMELWVEGKSMDSAEVIAQIHQSIALTSDAIQPYPEGGYANMSFTSPEELLANPGFKPEDCSIYGVMTLYRYPQKNAELVRMGCEDEARMLQVSLAVVIAQ